MKAKFYVVYFACT